MVFSDGFRLMIALFLIGVIFSILGAVMAYLITYQEYVHHYKDKGDAIRASMRTAVMTFIVFIGLSVFLAVFLRKFIF